MPEECMLSECTICLVQYTEETKKTTECHHIFHQECLDKWLQTNNSCPLCRTELVVSAPIVNINVVRTPQLWETLLDLHTQRSRFCYGRRQFHKK